MRPSLLHLLRTKCRRLPMGLALLSFVLMQWIATLHGIVHDGFAHPAQVESAAPAPAWAASDSPGIGHLLMRLVSSHEDGSSLCLGIDHLTHSTALTAVLPSLSLPPPTCGEPGWAYASIDAPAAAVYLARAPPALG